MKNQYAYTEELSTTDALVKFSSDTSAGLDKTDTVTLQALLLDFSKAFDRMRPDIAVSKLLSLNVSPSLVKVTMSFLTNRQQQVKSQGKLSKLKPSRIGVPQGTILGPLLWNVFVNDLEPNTNHIKYADDTTLYNTVRLGDVEISDSTAHRATISFTQNPLQEAASYAAAWCDSNEMLLNTTKSMCISFTLQKHLTVEPITINGCEIEQKEEVKLLGVTFDSHMRFSTHVDNIIRRTKPAFHAIIRLKKAGLTPTNLVLFYKSRIVSILTYCSPSWYPYISGNDKTKLERYERLCLRIILPNIDSYDEQLGLLNLSPINAQLDASCTRYIEKIRNSHDHPLHHYIPVAPNHLHHANRYRPRNRTALMDKNVFVKYL